MKHEADAWMLRYSDLIGHVDEYLEEFYGEELRDDLITHLGVDGWLHMGPEWLRVCREAGRLS